MLYPYFDMHCDTALKIYREGETLTDASGHLSLSRAKAYKPYIQVFAVWTDNKIPYSQAYDDFFKIKDYLCSQLSLNGIPLIRHRQELENSPPAGAVLAVEGADLLDGRLERLHTLYDEGARILTLMWRDENLCGGAWNSRSGLSAFGRDVIKLCSQLGIIVDTSHMSRSSFWDCVQLTETPVIASHSNSSSVFGHERNLDDEQFIHIRDRGGIVGISLCSHHVAYNPDIDSVAAHIERYLSLDGEDTICMGCDLDGMENLPSGIGGLEDIYKIALRLKSGGISDGVIHKILYQNAYDFMRKALPSKSEEKTTLT